MDALLLLLSFVFGKIILFQLYLEDPSAQWLDNNTQQKKSLVTCPNPFLVGLHCKGMLLSIYVYLAVKERKRNKI